MGDCVFCNIINGVALASVVYADEKVMAIMDIQPVNPGHVLIIPKTHAAQLSELDKETGAHMFKIAMCIAEALGQSRIKCEGINLFLADGEAAFQDIFHVHLHVIPRFKGDSFEIKVVPHYSLKPGRKELNRIAEKVRGYALEHYLSELVGVSLGRTIRSKVYKLHKKRKKFPELKVIWVVL